MAPLAPRPFGGGSVPPAHRRRTLSPARLTRFAQTRTAPRPSLTAQRPPLMLLPRRLHHFSRRLKALPRTVQLLARTMQRPGKSVQLLQRNVQPLPQSLKRPGKTVRLLPQTLQLPEKRLQLLPKTLQLLAESLQLFQRGQQAMGPNGTNGKHRSQPCQELPSAPTHPFPEPATTRTRNPCAPS